MDPLIKRELVIHNLLNNVDNFLYDGKYWNLKKIYPIDCNPDTEHKKITEQIWSVIREIENNDIKESLKFSIDFSYNFFTNKNKCQEVSIKIKF